MKKFKWLKDVDIMAISFVLAGLVIGLLIVFQFKSAVITNNYLADEIQTRQELIASFEGDKNLLQAQINALRIQVEKIHAELEKSGEANALVASLESLKTKLGLNRLQGEGLRIVLQDGASAKLDPDNSMIHAADLRDLVNTIRTGNPLGIAINGQRITLNSTINSLGGTIMVNKTSMTTPFEITVIGDVALISNRLADPTAYPDLYSRIKNKNIVMKVEKMGALIVPPAENELILKYAQ